MAHIRTILKSRRDFAKTLHGMIAANPADGFSSMVLATIDQDITALNTRLHALRPPEARLNQLSGELKHKHNLHSKLVAELTAMDTARTHLISRVEASKEELAQMQIDFDQLKPAPTEVPGPAMAAFQQVLVALGQGPLYDQLKHHLQGLGLNVSAGMDVDAAGSPAAVAPPVPSPFSPTDPAAAAAAAFSAAACSPFHGAAAAATHSRAAELATAADAAQVLAAGATAQAAALAMQANHALSQAHAYQEQLQQQQAYLACAAAATAAAATGAAAFVPAAAAPGPAPPADAAVGAAATPPAAAAAAGRQFRSATRLEGSAPSPRASRSPRRPDASRPDSVDSRAASPPVGLFD